MKHSIWPFIQKDKEGNLIMYPATFIIPTKGYIIKKEKDRKDFVMINIPVCLLGFFSILHTVNSFSFMVVFLSFGAILYVVQSNYLKRYPTSPKKFSWSERFDIMASEYSFLSLIVHLSLFFMIILFCISADNVHFYKKVLGIIILSYAILTMLIAMIYKIRG